MRQPRRDAVVQPARASSGLGEAQLELLRETFKADDYEQGLTVLNAYLNTVKNLDTSLTAAVPDPEKKPAGFKELESHLRKSVRSLNEIVRGLPFDQREPFEADRRELEIIDDKLLRALFPRRPAC
jgi:hypothetical protein